MQTHQHRQTGTATITTIDVQLSSQDMATRAGCQLAARRCVWPSRASLFDSRRRAPCLTKFLETLAASWEISRACCGRDTRWSEEALGESARGDGRHDGASRHQRRLTVSLVHQEARTSWKAKSQTSSTTAASGRR